MTPFKLDWTEWRSVQWRDWFPSSGLVRTDKKIPGRNLLADDIIGTFTYNGEVVELSEVVMPDFGVRPETKSRYVGITWLGSNGESVNGGLVESFAELESALEGGCPNE